MNRQGVQSIEKKAPDADLSDNSKTSLVFCVTVGPGDYDEEKSTIIYVDASQSCPIKYIYINI